MESHDGKVQEIAAWKLIYNIEERYIGFVKGRIQKWFNAYWLYLSELHHADLPEMTEDQKRQVYFASLAADEAECLNIIRKPALLAFLRIYGLERARQEAQCYS